MKKLFNKQIQNILHQFDYIEDEVTNFEKCRDNKLYRVCI